MQPLVKAISVYCSFGKHLQHSGAAISKRELVREENQLSSAYHLPSKAATLLGGRDSSGRSNEQKENQKEEVNEAFW